MGMLLAYVRRRPEALALVTLLGAFTWPTLLHAGVILLVFPPAPPRASPGAPGRLGPLLLAGAAALTATSAALYLHYFVGYRGLYPVAPAMENVLFLSAALVGVYLFFAAAPLLPSCLLPDQKILTRQRLTGACLGLALVAAVKLSVHALAGGPPPALTPATTLLIIPELAIARPLVFAVAHVLYYGPMILLAAFAWGSCCRTARSMGWGIPLLLLLGIAMSISSESRWLIIYIPFLAAVLVKTLDGCAIGKAFGAAFLGISLVLSKVWMPFNFADPSQADPAAKRTCLELYVAGQGPWMSTRMYLIQGAVVIVLGLLLWSLAKARLPKPLAGPAQPAGQPPAPLNDP